MGPCGARSSATGPVGEWRHTRLDPIRERLEVVGGRFHVARSSAQGTTVELWIPVDAVPASVKAPFRGGGSPQDRAAWARHSQWGRVDQANLRR
jgi:hypothetical protein